MGKFFVTILILGLLGVFGYYGYQAYQEQPSELPPIDCSCVCDDCCCFETTEYGGCPCVCGECACKNQYNQCKDGDCCTDQDCEIHNVKK